MTREYGVSIGLEVEHELIESVLEALHKEWKWDFVDAYNNTIRVEGTDYLRDHEIIVDLFGRCCLAIWKVTGKYVVVHFDFVPLNPGPGGFTTTEEMFNDLCFLI